MMQLLSRLKGSLELQIERLRLRGQYTSAHHELDPLTHLRAAAEWLCRAQDWGADDGVSYGCRFGEGFMASYPETTGYIIPPDRSTSSLRVARRV